METHYFAVGFHDTMQKNNKEVTGVQTVEELITIIHEVSTGYIDGVDEVLIFRCLKLPTSIEDWNSANCHQLTSNLLNTGHRVDDGVIQFTHNKYTTSDNVTDEMVLIDDTLVFDYYDDVLIYITNMDYDKKIAKIFNTIKNNQNKKIMTIKESITDNSITFQELYDKLQFKNIGNWDSINSEDTIMQYITDMRKKDVKVGHIWHAIEENPSEEDLYCIDLGMSLNTPTPINDKKDLIEALGLDEQDLEEIIIFKNE